MKRPGRTTAPEHGLVVTLALLALAFATPADARQIPGQDTTGHAVVGEPATPPTPALDPTLPNATPMAPVAAVESSTAPLLAPSVQIVRFSGPPGLEIELVEPPPIFQSSPSDEPDPGALTVGLQVGVGYRLRIANLPNRPGAEFFPVVEVVGHLHRPASVDPTRFPIRVVFGLDDLIDVADNGRLVTQIIYLEDPSQAIPISLPAEEIPVVTLDSVEEPLRVADALGRVMAIVRLGGRLPLPGEPFGFEDLNLAAGPCLFEPINGGRCEIPVCPPLSPSRPSKPIFPEDEYLCDGGDHGSSAGVGPGGEVVGVEPRDALVRFNAGRAPRVLPTNTVCIYAPRFAAVRTSLGPNESQSVAALVNATKIARMAQEGTIQPPSRMTQNLSADANRGRARASNIESRTPPITHIEVRVLNALSAIQVLDVQGRAAGPEEAFDRVRPAINRESVAPLGIKTAEGAVISGVVQGAGQTITAWGPEELAGIEEPPDRPGLAVVKEADLANAEPGQVVSFTIRWRNMGNVPILNVSVVDSLMPRLEYVPESARGPEGSIFTAAENTVGSTELRWDLPEAVMPGRDGAVSFQARVR